MGFCVILGLTFCCWLRICKRFDYRLLGLMDAYHLLNAFCRRWSCHLALNRLEFHREGLGDGAVNGIRTFCRST